MSLEGSQQACQPPEGTKGGACEMRTEKGRGNQTSMQLGHCNGRPARTIPLYLAGRPWAEGWLLYHAQQRWGQTKRPKGRRGKGNGMLSVRFNWHGSDRKFTSEEASPCPN